MYVTKEVEVEVDLGDFDSQVLIDELQQRDHWVPDQSLLLLIQDVYEKRRLGQDYQKALDDLIYSTIGRIS
jgi:hypothetical protein|tara:strand:- start:240 stop:452 length:213 start_codon:yes stop_codon:yes gene_type:complete